MKNSEFVNYLNELIKERKPFAVATVVKIEGSSLGKPGFKSIIDSEGRIIYGTLGGVCPESAVSSY
ncbi:MAG: XdhC family protein, partial [Thermoproteota archaeon]|nr:XdhC family protein [Thermoproteota archaeon]